LAREAALFELWRTDSESDGDITERARQGGRKARRHGRLFFYRPSFFFLECGPVANNARPAPDEIRALAGRGGVKVLTPCFGAGEREEQHLKRMDSRAAR
jgi:hypothetical protein